MIAGKDAKDGILAAITATAAKAIDKTQEDWGPFDAKDRESALKEIIQLSQ